MSDLRISSDGSKLFCLDQANVQAWSIWTGEAVGKVCFGSSGEVEFLAIDGSRVWIDFPWSRPHGWDFTIPEPFPIYLFTLPPDVPHPNGTQVRDSSLSRVEDRSTGKVVFQLPKGFGRPVCVQWNGQYLTVHLRSKEVLILEFHPKFL